MKVSIHIGLGYGLLALMAVAVALAQGPSYSVPMGIIHGKPYVMVTINGKGPYQFLVDTGTGGEAIITPGLAAELHLPLIGTMSIRDPSGLAGPPASLVSLDTLNIAGLDFYSVKAIEHELLSSDGNCQGMLGFALFRGYLLTLDYPGKRLNLSDAELEPDGDRLVHPFRLENGVPIARLMIGDQQVEALIDSGGMGLDLPEKMAPSLRFLVDPAPFGNGRSLSTRFPIAIAQLATNVRMGEVTFEKPWIELNPAFPMANFGSLPMQEFVMTFDQENLLLRMDGPRRHLPLEMPPRPIQLVGEPPPPPESPGLVPVG